MVIQRRKAASRADVPLGSVARTAARRHMLPTNGLATAISVFSLVALAVVGCANYKPTVPPSKGHINAGQFPEKAADDKILPPVTTSQE